MAGRPVGGEAVRQENRLKSDPSQGCWGAWHGDPESDRVTHGSVRPSAPRGERENPLRRCFAPREPGLGLRGFWGRVRVPWPGRVTGDEGPAPGSRAEGQRSGGSEPHICYS